jgi:LPS-assembly protein
MHREMYDINAEVSTDLFKVFKIKEQNIRHTIRPEIIYTYIPDQDQNKYPFFDSSDRVEKENKVTYSVTNTFTGDKNGLYCRFKAEQTYDFNRSDDKPLKPIYAEIELTPNNFLSLQADAEWSIYENSFQSRDIAMHISDKRGDRIFAEYRYTRDETESFRTNFAIKLSAAWNIYADYERNIYEGKDIRTSLGFLYNGSCWSADLSYTDEDNDRKYSFMINLQGLGSEK